MFLSEPGTTNYDLNFSMFGFPVRVHPAFFIMPLLLGAPFLQSPDVNAGVALLTLMAVFFVAVLVHELGHAFAFRYFGIESRVVLYWMGGLAIPDRGNSWSQPTASLNPRQQIVVSLAGPIFGFLLAALLVGMVMAIGGTVRLGWLGIIPMPISYMPDGGVPDALLVPLSLFFKIGIFANIFLNILNLAPVYPLDGGQVARQVFVINDPWNGVRYSVMLSILAGGLVALMSFMSGDRFIGFFFGFMAWSNYMSLQQMGGGGYGGGYGGGRPW